MCLFPRASALAFAVVGLAACGDGGDVDEARSSAGNYSAAATKACLEDRGQNVAFATEGEIVIPESADKIVGRQLIVFGDPPFTIVFTKGEREAKEIEAVSDTLAAESPEPPNDIAAHRGNAVYTWGGAERPSEEVVEEIVDCLR